MTLAEIAAALFRRADLPGDDPKWVLADEAAQWSAGDIEALEAMGFVKLGPPRTYVSCDECNEPHSERVLFREDDAAGSRAFIPCRENGRVFIEPDRLRQWWTDADTIAALAAKAIGATTTPGQVLLGRSWDLGVSSLAGERRRAYLVRGACWPDAPAVLRNDQFKEPSPLLLLLAHEAPTAWTITRQWVPLAHALNPDAGPSLFDFTLLAPAATDVLTAASETLFVDSGLLRNNDYTAIVWRDTPFSFSRPEARAVELLHGAYKSSGSPDIHQQRLLAAVNELRAYPTTLRDLFRRTGAWKTLVIPGRRRGFYRLDLP